VALVTALVPLLGLKGAGVAFFASYVLHGFLVYAIVRRLSAFRWSRENRQYGVIFALSISSVFAAFQLTPRPVAVSVGALATFAGSVYSLRTLVNLVSADRLPLPVRRLLGRLRLVPVSPPG